MLEFYPQIKAVHIAAVMASGSLFLVRGAAVQLGAAWAMAAPLRYLSYAIDTALLTAALMLATIIHQFPFVQGWLTAKVLLLVVYVVLGSFSLKAGPHARRAHVLLGRCPARLSVHRQYRPRSPPSRNRRAAHALSGHCGRPGTVWWILVGCAPPAYARLRIHPTRQDGRT